jgi:mRNA interferase MazF
MVDKNFIPHRGDIVWIDFSPTRGHEQSSVRPALVLSAKTYNQKTGLMIVCAITSHSKGYPYEVQVRGKKIEGVVLADQIRSVAWKEREASFVQVVSQSIINEVEEKLATLLFA